MLETIEQVARRIQAGEPLFLTGPAGALAQLPEGDWIGGTCAYFVDVDGGTESADKVFVSCLPPEARFEGIQAFREEDLPALWTASPTRGFTYLLLPHSGTVRLRYAQNALLWPGLMHHPVVGMVSGFPLSSAKKPNDALFHGRLGLVEPNCALALFASLPAGYEAKVRHIPLWTPDSENTDEIVFLRPGVEAVECTVNGVHTNFAEYVEGLNLPRTVFCYEPPLVGSYRDFKIGSMIDKIEDGVAYFGYPIFAGATYRWGRKRTDYLSAVSEYAKQAHPAFCCTCILNYTGFDLENKVVPGFYGPAAMGEIAYGLYSYSTVYLEIAGG
jgi:hypothetical protein